MISNIKGIGIDMVSFKEIEPRISDAFVKRVLSPQERALYDAFKHPTRKLEFIAGRFAGKEAFVKAYQHFQEPLNFNQVSILPNQYGAPEIDCDCLTTVGLHISISHTNEHAIAIVIRT